MKGRVLAMVIAAVLKAISPLLRRTLDELINNMYRTALSTDVDFDDALVESLAELLKVELIEPDA